MQQWKIRILSGVHSGVEVTLPNESLVVGSDDFIADLVLTDSGVNARHLVLVCDSESVLLKDGEDVSVNHERIELNSDGIELTRNSLVSVGQLTFAVGYLTNSIFNGIINNQSVYCCFLFLANSADSSNRLIFKTWIPNRVKNKAVVCHGQCESCCAREAS